MKESNDAIKNKVTHSASLTTHMGIEAITEGLATSFIFYFKGFYTYSNFLAQEATAAEALETQSHQKIF